MSITLGALLPVGSVIHSMLTESQFQSQAGSGWVLADGRSATGTVYNTITGASTIPDMRAVHLRGKDNARGLNPDGDLALGTYTADKYTSHSHVQKGAGGSAGITGSRTATNSLNAQSIITVDSTDVSGGNETAPKTVTVNIFIRVN